MPFSSSKSISLSILNKVWFYIVILYALRKTTVVVSLLWEEKLSELLFPWFLLPSETTFYSTLRLQFPWLNIIFLTETSYLFLKLPRLVTLLKTNFFYIFMPVFLLRPQSQLPGISYILGSYWWRRAINMFHRIRFLVLTESNNFAKCFHLLHLTYSLNCII